MSDPTTVLVVSFDCWPWPALGCYGHEWIDTPAWDRLAAEGFVFDRCVATIDRDQRTRGDLWNDFLTRLRLAGHKTTLYRESLAAPLGPDALWDNAYVITGNPDPNAPLAEQPFAKVTQAAIAELTSGSTDTARLVWVHGVGLPERCPVSRAALELYAADFAEEGLRLSAMSDGELIDHELTRATTLSVLDHWLGELLDAMRALPGRKQMTVFAWAGAIWEPVPRRTPLIAAFDPQASQVPCIIGGDGILPGRTNALATTGDLFPTIAGCLSLPVESTAQGTDLSALVTGDVDSIRAMVRQQCADRGALWTSEDLTLFARHGEEWTPQRYLWPDDGWAIHDIAAQTPDVTEQCLAQFRGSVR